MTEDALKWVMGLFMAMMTGFIFWAIWVSIKDSDRHEADRLVCESKGGIQLERTYSMGKTTGHSYTCINKDIIID